MTAFKIVENKKAAYLTDYEMNMESPKYSELVEFCKGADVVLHIRHRITT